MAGPSEAARYPSESSRIHRVVVDGLAPDTTYHYRVRSTAIAGGVGDGAQSVASAEHPFKTAVGTGRPYAFAVTSETGGYGDDAINRRLFALIARYRPEFVLLVGDAVGDGREYDDWGRHLFTPGRELFAHTPFYLCPGNHEAHAAWFKRFTAYPPPHTYYAFDYGDAHFVALDSTELVAYVDGRPRPSAPSLAETPQYAFLDDDLSRSRATWKMVFFHYPPYVSGDYEVEAMRALCPVLEAHGVDVVFTSHTIVYERSHPIRAGRLDLDRGVVYVVAGGAGAKPDWFHHKWAWHTAQAVAVPHFVQVAIAGPTLELRAIDVDGRLFDLARLDKRS